MLNNCKLAYKARAAVPWSKDIPEAIFLNDVLPYANVDEKRDAWRAEFFELCLPMVKECKTPAEAAWNFGPRRTGSPDSATAKRTGRAGRKSTVRQREACASTPESAGTAATS